MFAFMKMRDQLVMERKKNAELQARLLKTNADIEYLSMMSDVDLEQEVEENQGEMMYE